MKKKEGWYFERLVVLAIAMALVASVAITAYTTDDQKAENALTPSPALQSMKNATPAGNVLLPSKVVKSPPIGREPIHNPAGSEMYVAPLTTVPNCDGHIDPTEWADAYVYDVSDTSGQSDGIPDPLGTVFLWLKQDDNGVYFAIRNYADQVLDEYDQCGLYFDDDYDGCWPVSATNEGNNWLVYSAGGNFVRWRWWQDYDCGFPPTYYCTYDNVVTVGDWTPACFGIGIGPTGNVDYEVMIPYGTIDEYLDLTMPPESLGFYMYCLDNGPVSFNGEWPSQYYPTTYNEPCYFGRLICGEVEEWPNHKMHFPQLPDTIGWDVYATEPKTLADDWQCSRTGPVKDIHFWGSWKDLDGNPYTDDFFTEMPWFIISIHDNIPADPDTPWSRPGALLWRWEGEIPGTPSEPPTLEHWLDPNTGECFYNDHVAYWRYDFVDIPEPFIQYKDSIYWLDISALYIQPPFQWGWKSSRDHFMDDAVYTDNAPAGPWFPIIEPPRYNEFEIYYWVYEPIEWWATNYYGAGWYYYEQYNWWNIWFYDNPFTWDRQKHIFMEFYLEDLAGDAMLALNWSTPDWDTLGMGRPPLPGDGPEDLFIGRQEFPLIPGWNIIDYWLDWNPEWISIDFMGTNFMVYEGKIWHECVQTSLDLAFVITGPECWPSIDVEKKVWDETLQEWVDSTEVDSCTNADFLITVHNDGSCCDLTNITVSDCVDSSLDYQYADPPPDLVQPYPGGVCLEWYFDGPLPPCDTIEITVTYHAVGPPCHVDTNFVGANGFCESAGQWVYDEDMAWVHVTPGEPEWPNHKMHYPQLPDPYGWDVVATMGYIPPSPHPGIVVADDFMCTKSVPIIDLHFWGSWLYDYEVDILGFWLSIHSNDPGPPSHPAEELWSAYITDFEVVGPEPGVEGWWDPYSGACWPGDHQTYYRYDITYFEEPFYQDSGTIYWLNICADIGPPGYMGYPEPPLWGWKTSLNHWNDDAAWSVFEPPVYPFGWIPLEDCMTGQTLDMAFVITGDMLCGDVNNNGIVDLGDLVYLIAFLYRGGPPPVPMTCVGDCNGDGAVTIGDVVHLIAYLYRGSGIPPYPYCCTPPWLSE